MFSQASKVGWLTRYFLMVPKPSRVDYSLPIRRYCLVLMTEVSRHIYIYIYIYKMQIMSSSLAANSLTTSFSFV